MIVVSPPLRGGVGQDVTNYEAMPGAVTEAERKFWTVPTA